MAKRAGRVEFGSGQSGRGSKRVIFKRVNRVTGQTDCGSNGSDPFCHVYISPTHMGRVELMSLTNFIIIIIIKLIRKKYKYKYIKKTQRLVSM